ncbi:MAG: serine/threonine-protein kinase, partial [Acidobacteriota bacterium]
MTVETADGEHTRIWHRHLSSSRGSAAGIRRRNAPLKLSTEGPRRGPSGLLDSSLPTLACRRFPGARALSSHAPPDSIGPYRLGDKLGAGGMGEVYRAYDSRLDRFVALKRVRPGVGDPELARKRFHREAKAAARLRHPAIVQVHDWVESEDHAWLVIELVDGRSLREELAPGPLEPDRVVAIARDLLQGLGAAHAAGLVHRDLKAGNVMLSPVSSGGRGRTERAQILDFGLAKEVRFEDESQLSVDGRLVGTLSALAPEQVLGEKVDARTDLFALGCLLYEALTGAKPFVGQTAGETLHRICTDFPEPIPSRNPDVSEPLSAFVNALLQKDPRRRPASAGAALDQLDALAGSGSRDGAPSAPAGAPASLEFATLDEGSPQVLATAVAAAEPPTPEPPSTRPRFRRRALAAAGAAFAALGAWLLTAER